MLLVLWAQTAFAPEMAQLGDELIDTVLVQVLLHPLLLVIVRVKVNEPELPAITETDCELVEPLIVPLPLIDQLYEVMPPGLE